MTDMRQLLIELRSEVLTVSRKTVAEIEVAVARQIERAERALAASDIESIGRIMRPMIADLRRLRAGIHRHVYKPTGIIPPETDPAQEAALLLAEIGFCSDHMARALDRLSQLDEAGKVISWLKH